MAAARYTLTSGGTGRRTGDGEDAEPIDCAARPPDALAGPVTALAPGAGSLPEPPASLSFLSQPTAADRTKRVNRTTPHTDQSYRLSPRSLRMVDLLRRKVGYLVGVPPDVEP